jgi:DNA-binding transcriptional LysR family regulator
MAPNTGRITLWGIEVFLATLDEGSVSGAARRLRASISSVSQQITSLEGALGVALIDRSTRPVQATPAGQVFRQRAQTILSQAQLAQAEVAQHDLTALTDFRLGMIEDFDRHITPELLSDLGQAYSACKFVLETGASHRLLDLLDTRALDVVVAAEFDAVRHGETVEVHPLIQDPFVAVVPKGVVAAGTDTLAALGDMPLIQYTSRHYMGRQIAQHLEHAKVPLARRFELDSYNAILGMVAGGMGWTILTALACHSVAKCSERVDLMPLPFGPLSRRITLTARKGVLGALPEQVAGRLRPLLQARVVRPMVQTAPWLADDLRVLS